MPLWSFKSLLGLGAFLSLVASQIADAGMDDITRIYQSSPSIHAFEVCSGGGCALLHQVSIDQDEWQSIAAIFDTSSNLVIENPAEQERAFIALAIAQFETIIGRKTNTSQDLAGTFHKMAGQLDCNDEAINTTSYLRLLKSAGLLVWHEVSDLRIRQYFFSGWPHTAASVREISSQALYVVDSWFYDNGSPAVILPLELWKTGYIPTDSPLLQPLP